MMFRALVALCLVQVIVWGQNQKEIEGCYDYEVCVDPYYCQSGSIDGNTIERNYFYVSHFRVYPGCYPIIHLSL